MLTGLKAIQDRSVTGVTRGPGGAGPRAGEPARSTPLSRAGPTPPILTVASGDRGENTRLLSGSYTHSTACSTPAPKQNTDTLGNVKTSVSSAKSNGGSEF